MSTFADAGTISFSSIPLTPRPGSIKEQFSGRTFRTKESTEISVLLGTINTESRSGRATVQAGRALVIGDDRYAEEYPVAQPDAWEQWNRDRDRYYTGSYTSSRYLPDELNTYSPYFDQYGSWGYVRDYGYVWSPGVSVSVSLGWSPYKMGRWARVRGDYVWISYEPWGWVPHHYGRWVHVAPRGWCWVPPARGTVYWGPGYVGWVYTPSYVAWVPLAPREVYYGYGHYGPHSVNIYNVNINKIFVQRDYRNVHVQHGVTVVNRDTFITGRGTALALQKNPFLTERVSVGRPLIRPERATSRPVIRDIPVAKQPPQQIRDLRVDELKHRRPMVKERTRSVLSPQSQQKTMPLRVFSEKRGSENRSFIERDSTPARTVRPPERQKTEAAPAREKIDAGKQATEKPKEKVIAPADRRPATTGRERQAPVPDRTLKPVDQGRKGQSGPVKPMIESPVQKPDSSRGLREAPGRVKQLEEQKKADTGKGKELRSIQPPDRGKTLLKQPEPKSGQTAPPPPVQRAPRVEGQGSSGQKAPEVRQREAPKERGRLPAADQQVEPSRPGRFPDDARHEASKGRGAGRALRRRKGALNPGCH
ncbi:MAG: hypothetical protein MZV70_13445 [Desulfobacterales bacterium]|nr:hypothetical protein [Desulfobacterales bacterium]